MMNPLLSIQDVTVNHRVGSGCTLHAVSGVSLDIAPGETLGLVGESGCGKSSLARAVMQLPAPTSGKVILAGEELTVLKGEPLRRLRGRFQMIFQDPLASLNPRRRVGESVEAPLQALGGVDASQRRRRVEEQLSAVGLDPAWCYGRRPDQLSGGQCQRVSIARALITRPRLLVCDEPVSALDVSVQAQILNLLREVKRELGLSMLFIGHDLAVVRNISDRVAVMYLGRICEIAPCATLYAAPAHHYTRVLLDAVPHPDPRRPLPPPAIRSGELPSPVDPPSGCRFRTRCLRADPQCARFQPPLREIAPGHLVACHHPLTEQ